MTTFCSQCGTPLTSDTNFCSHCGAATPFYSSRAGASSVDPTVLSSPSAPPLPIPPTSYGSPYQALLPNPYSIPPPPPPRSSRKRLFGLLIGIGLLLIVLISAGITALLVRGANITSLSTSGETVLYAADWSNGLNGWTGTSDWKASGGMLQNDGTDSSIDSPTIVAPYHVDGRADYAVEVKMQVVAGPVCFDITTLRASGVERLAWQGYKATICGGNAAINAGNIAGVSYDHLAQVHFDPGNGWHTYRFAAQGNKLSLFIDGTLVLEVNDNRYSSGGNLGFKSFETQLNVSSFRVIAL